MSAALVSGPVPDVLDRSAVRALPLAPEVLARLDEALSAAPPSTGPADAANALWELLQCHGYGRAAALQLAATLVDMVTDDLRRGRG